MDYRKIAEDALRERAEIFEKRKALVESDATEAEKREQSERMDADMDRLAGEAREAVQAGEREAEIRDLSTRAGSLSVPTPDEKRERGDRDEFLENLRAVGRGDLRSLDFTASAGAFDKRANLVSDGLGANKGGNAGPLTPDTFVAQLLESLEEASDVVARVRKISTSTGEPMNWPRRLSKAGNTFQKIQEAGTYQAASDGSFDLFTLLAFKFGAIAEISEEALNDPALNVGAIVARDMGEDLAESLAAEIWNGTDLSETLLGNVVNGNTLAAAGAPTFDELIDLQHSIISKYRRNAAFYVNDLTARDLRKVKNNDGDYIWQPAVIAGQPDLLLGKPVSTDPVLPTTALNAKGAVVFGDLNRAYTLRNVRQIGITRSDEFGFDRDTVALKIKWRGDGGVTDPEAYAATTNPAA